MPKEPRPLHDLHPLRLLPLALCLAMVVFCIIRGGFSVEDILSYAPAECLAGRRFPAAALPRQMPQRGFSHHRFTGCRRASVCPCGGAGAQCFRPCGGSHRSLLDRPVFRQRAHHSAFGPLSRLDGLLESQEGHYLFLSFFLRVIYLLPGDIVSMYFGSVRGPYLTCLLGGLLGGLPSLLAATLLGASVSQPGSPAFWLALGITAGVSVLSLLGYLLWQKRQKNKI